ncbi:MAG: carbamoyltransferase [Alphaproteobacteria bacterium]|nr:carbamoyltransferase [Alphaproteobacteria bacterium]
MDSVILGIHDGHEASACVMVGGEVISAAQEERFSGLKVEYGYPAKAIEACLSLAGLSEGDIDEVVIASHTLNPSAAKVKRAANFSVSDWIREQHEYWKPKLLDGREVDYWSIFAGNEAFRYDEIYPFTDEHLRNHRDPAVKREIALLRRNTAADRLGLSLDRVRTMTHEHCHAFYGYFASPLRGKVLSMTAEGVGDYSNGTVAVFSEQGGREELSSTLENHLGHMYQYITLLLGMKPVQHEYKVMGLAPYANDHEARKSYAVFRDVLEVRGLDVVLKNKPRDFYFHFRDALEGHRFDGISGGLQTFVEDILMEWVAAAVERTGLGRLTFSGGVAQNIKAVKRLAELEQVEDIFVCPAAGDTSLSIGACYMAAWERLRANANDPSSLRPLTHVYFGPAFENHEVEAFLAAERIAERYDVLGPVGPEQIAEHLAAGRILGRCHGRMEFGLRALGNRSILADPRNPDTVRRINAAIKYRDFWMPFTPSMLAERAADYLVNPKGLRGPFMTMAFDTTARARRDLPAALHPADFTVRPQIVEAAVNPAYHRLIKAFERLTGVGALLNTSFNLHGEPIVLGPAEAIHTLDNSDLDGVILQDFLILRRS